MLKQFYELFIAWLKENIFYQSPTPPAQTSNYIIRYEIQERKTLDEMSEEELKYEFQIPNIIKAIAYVDHDLLSGRGFTKIDKIINSFSSYLWTDKTLTSLKLVAFEMQCTLQKAIDTYEIYIMVPRLELDHDQATIWIRPRDRDYKPIKDKKKEEPKEETIETEIIKPRTMAATNSPR